MDKDVNKFTINQFEMVIVIYENQIVLTVTEPVESRKYGATQCVASIDVKSGELRRIYPITPIEVERLNIHRGSLLKVAINPKKTRENKDKRIESRKVETRLCENIGKVPNDVLKQYADDHVVGCSFIKQCRPFKKPDPSFYVTRVHNVRPHTKNGIQYWRFKCEDPDCKGHDMKSSDIDNRELKEGDRILLGRHSQERIIHPYLVGIIG